MNLDILYDAYRSSTGVATDTRNIKAGNIFFALKGERFNGNEFAANAIKAGAKYVVIDEPEYKKEEEAYIVVDDVLKSLQALAHHHRMQLDIPVIGITGSNGKTTTKELVREVLSSTYKVHCTEGNFNNHIGVPLTLLAMPLDTELAIIEMGANHPYEIEFLCQIAHPNHGLVTNVGKAHLEGFGGFEGVIKTKGEMYDYLAAHEGIAFVNREERHLSEMALGCKNVKGYGSQIGLKVENKGAHPFLVVEFESPEAKYTLQSQLIGSYNYPNILTAITLGRYFSVPPQKIQASIEAYAPQNNRSQLVMKGANKIIMDAYNANPTSMKAAIFNFSQMKAQHKVLIMGDMLELGSESHEEHHAILELARESGFDAIYTVGKEFSKVDDSEHAFETIQQLKSTWDWSQFEASTFLIKGSRGIRLEHLLKEG